MITNIDKRLREVGTNGRFVPKVQGRKLSKVQGIPYNESAESTIEYLRQSGDTVGQLKFPAIVWQGEGKEATGRQDSQDIRYGAFADILAEDLGLETPADDDADASESAKNAAKTATK